MSVPIRGTAGAPSVRPADARFSSGPCRKHPGWTLSALNTEHLGHSHRASAPKARLKLAIDRQHALLGLPEDWVLGIVPGSDTGAFELAMWSLLGLRPVDVLAFEAFSSDWARDLEGLGLTLHRHDAPFGKLPDTSKISPNHDLVLVYNGTTSGVRFPNLDFIADDRDGLVLCDATSAAFAMPMDYSKLDVLTWSWQKVLGGEAAHGMLALSPRAVARLENDPTPRPLPKLFRLSKGGQLIDGIFRGETINTPSMLAVEDLHSALDWADSIGGLSALHARSDESFKAVDDWVQRCPVIRWLAEDPATRSNTSMCLVVDHPAFNALSVDDRQGRIKNICKRLADAEVAYDIANYRAAPPGFRLWAGATVDPSDIAALTPWIEYELNNELTALENNT